MKGKILKKDHEDCDGGLLPASNIKDCFVCLKCGFIKRVKEYEP